MTGKEGLDKFRSAGLQEEIRVLSAQAHRQHDTEREPRTTRRIPRREFDRFFRGALCMFGAK